MKGRKSKDGRHDSRRLPAANEPMSPFDLPAEAPAPVTALVEPRPARPASDHGDDESRDSRGD